MRAAIPNIRRAWDARSGQFVWQCSPRPSGFMGTGISHQATYDWNRAERWCTLRNAAQRSQGGSTSTTTIAACAARYTPAPGTVGVQHG